MKVGPRQWSGYGAPASAAGLLHNFIIIIIIARPALINVMYEW